MFIFLVDNAPRCKHGTPHLKVPVAGDVVAIFGGAPGWDALGISLCPALRAETVVVECLPTSGVELTAYRLVKFPFLLISVGVRSLVQLVRPWIPGSHFKIELLKALTSLEEYSWWTRPVR